MAALSELLKIRCLDRDLRPIFSYSIVEGTDDLAVDFYTDEHIYGHIRDNNKIVRAALSPGGILAHYDLI